MTTSNGSTLPATLREPTPAKPASAAKRDGRIRTGDLPADNRALYTTELRLQISPRMRALPASAHIGPWKGESGRSRNGSAKPSRTSDGGGRRDRLPATGDRDVAVLAAPEPAVAHRRSCQRVSAPPPPHRSALEACRSQLHVRARALHQPLFRHSLSQPVGRLIFNLLVFRRGCRLCRRPLAAALVRAKSSCFGEAEADFGR
jgi:hypothetical protein